MTKEFSWTRCFRIRPHIQQSFPCSLQSINLYHSPWCKTYQDATFYVSIFLVSGKMKGKGARERNTSFSALLFSFFPSRGCTAMLFHTGFCSATRNWRELYKNLTVLSSLDAYTYRTRFNRKN